MGQFSEKQNWLNVYRVHSFQCRSNGLNLATIIVYNLFSTKAILVPKVAYERCVLDESRNPRFYM